MQYELIIFDLDDTLIDNLENVRYAYKKMIEYMGQEYNEQGFEKWLLFDKKFWIDFYEGKFSIPYEKNDSKFVPYVQSLRYYLFFNKQITMDKALEINDLFLSSLKEVVVPVEGAYETLEALSKKYVLVVATNGPKQAVESKLSKIDCLKFIRNIFSADMTKNKVTKPNKLFFEELFDYLDFHDKNKVLLVGDSLHSDIMGAMNAKIDSCWFNRNNETLPDEYEPTIVVEELKQLIKRL